MLVLADEDYTGVNPTYPAGTNAPRYAQQYVDAIRANGIRSVVWDVDKDGVPHDLGVLGHFDAVVWYLGDNRLTQDAADEPVRLGDRPAARLAGRRPREGPRAQRAVVPQRGRQAGARRRDHELLRAAARRQRRRHLLRPEGPSRGAVLHLDELPRRLRAAVGRLRPVLPGRLRPAGARHADRVHRHGQPVHRVHRRPRGHADQPAERGRRLPGDQHGAAAGRVPAVPEREGRRLRGRARAVRAGRGRSGTSPAPIRTACTGGSPARST